uniref:Pecanex C-terminal domain-containing protein n=1 Tax=Chromera velia CCMP2878 TaxID=1169474 RepID=A0A0G4EYH0_9ALVE|eukprot:Cvel_2532.t1-p1 / transcript=Cvel_2532.t1 / gene=Cvel_2532 / organism=Chromera_velia_CCMP2878 / gene_product=Pecanex-like protein 4, putative / transcript_product=Pecanex-like protein 4, putative / location=Cvel_scaffold100:32994-39860(+) / protein_length=1124 / sequence_SO=supercontig / SO=protein_coding / is_pseudo=false
MHQFLSLLFSLGLFAVFTPSVTARTADTGEAGAYILCLLGSLSASTVLASLLLKLPAEPNRFRPPFGSGTSEVAEHTRLFYACVLLLIAIVADANAGGGQENEGMLYESEGGVSFESIQLCVRVLFVLLPFLTLFGLLSPLDCVFTWGVQRLESDILGGSPRSPAEAAVMACFLSVSVLTILAVLLRFELVGPLSVSGLCLLFGSVSCGLPGGGVRFDIMGRKREALQRRWKRLFCSWRFVVPFSLSIFGSLVVVILGFVPSLKEGSERLIFNSCTDTPGQGGIDGVLRVCLDSVVSGFAIVVWVWETVFVNGGVRVMHQSIRFCSGPVVSVGECLRQKVRTGVGVGMRLILRASLLLHGCLFGLAGPVGWAQTNGIASVLMVGGAIRHIRRGQGTCVWYAGVIGLTGMIDLVTHRAGSSGGFLFVASESFAASGFPCVLLSFRYLILDLLLDRLGRLLSLTRYAVHLSTAIWKVPKQKHKAGPRAVLVSLVCAPLTGVLFVVTAVLRSPLVALFSLPIFVPGFPRPERELPPRQKAHAETGGKKKWKCGSFLGVAESGGLCVEICEGREGKFYEEAARSLMKSLGRMWVEGWAVGSEWSDGEKCLICNWHDKLLAFVRVLGSGSGWLEVEIRGVEMQEVTSCHHEEASRVAESFEALEHREGGGKRQTGEEGREEEEEKDAKNKVKMFSLDPLITPEGLSIESYEETRASLTGVIEQRSFLQSVYRRLLSTLLWSLSKKARDQRGFVPDSWRRLLDSFSQDQYRALWEHLSPDPLFVQKVLSGATHDESTRDTMGRTNEENPSMSCPLMATGGHKRPSPAALPFEVAVASACTAGKDSSLCRSQKKEDDNRDDCFRKIQRDGPRGTAAQCNVHKSLADGASGPCLPPFPLPQASYIARKSLQLPPLERKCVHLPPLTRRQGTVPETSSASSGESTLRDTELSRPRHACFDPPDCSHSAPPEDRDGDLQLDDVEALLEELQGGGGGGDAAAAPVLRGPSQPLRGEQHDGREVHNSTSLPGAVDSALDDLNRNGRGTDGGGLPEHRRGVASSSSWAPKRQPASGIGDLEGEGGGGTEWGAEERFEADPKETSIAKVDLRALAAAAWLALNGGSFDPEDAAPKESV